MRLHESSEAFLAIKAQEGFSHYTLRQYRHHYKHLILDLDDIDIEEITLQHLRHHISLHMHLKPSSIGQRVRAIKSLFKWLVEEEYLVRNPALKLKEPKQAQRIPKALTIEEVELLRDSCQTLQEHALIEFFFATGCRLSEVQRLNRNAIDWNRRSVTVLGKGNKEREVYFGARAQIWLQRYINSRKDTNIALFVTDSNPHNRMNPRTIQYVFNRVANRCGLKDKVHPHVLRHTLATTLLNQGAPLVAVQSILGHEKPETTQIYAQLSGTARQQAYQRYFVQ